MILSLTISIYVSWRTWVSSNIYVLVLLMKTNTQPSAPHTLATQHNVDPPASLGPSRRWSAPPARAFL